MDDERPKLNWVQEPDGQYMAHTENGTYFIVPDRDGFVLKFQKRRKKDDA